MLRQEVFTEVAHAEEHIQLRALAHHPEDHVGRQAGRVCAAPGQRQHRQAEHDQRQLMVRQGLQGIAGTPPAGRAGRAGSAPRPGDIAEQERHLLPGPDPQRAGERQVGAGDARVIACGGQADQGHAEQQGRARHRPRVGAARPAVEVQDHARAGPPREQRVGDRQQVQGHGRDGVQRQRLDHDRQRGGGVAFAGGEVAQHQPEADEEDEELDRREHALHQRPHRGVTSPAFFDCVQGPA